LDSSGALVASYTYNAWGGVLTATGTNSALANRNPIRYRGYYYDVETELYYLQSRYYDPEIGRFINADSYALTYNNAIGANMYAYCLNNPIINIDSGGEIVGTLFDVASWFVSVAEVSTNPYDMWAWAGLIADTFDLLPVVSGTGEAVRAIRTLDRTTEAFNALADAVQAGKRSGRFSSNLVGAIGEALEGIGYSGKTNIGGWIPDRIQNGVLTEVKNVFRITNTEQLRAFATYAAEQTPQLLLELCVRPTTSVSQSVIDSGWTIKFLW